jgi:death-on-curing protein
VVEGHGSALVWLDRFVQTIIRGHDRIIQETGGLPGVQTARLYAACARPFQTAFGEETYPEAYQKAAALFHGIVNNHPFADGNKRTATFAALVLLMNLFQLAQEPTELQVRFLGELAIETALPGSLTVDEIAFWFRRILGPR